MNKELYEKYKDLSRKVLNLRFTLLCLSGNLEEVSYILTSPDLKVHADIHTRGDQGLIYAFDGKHYDLVKYLLSSTNLKEHADINVSHGSVLLQCCVDGNLDMVKFLLSAPILKQHIDIEYHDDGFILACKNHHLDIIQYFIFDMQINKTIHIKNYLNEKDNDKSFIEQVNHLFSLRELGENLEKELSTETENTRKMKI
jgi:ankyrin repeat protein